MGIRLNDMEQQMDEHGLRQQQVWNLVGLVESLSKKVETLTQTRSSPAAHPQPEYKISPELINMLDNSQTESENQKIVLKLI